MNLDNIDIDDLTDICEGNESTAELLQTFIVKHPAADYTDQEERVMAIAGAFADYMNGFWDESATDQDGEPIDSEDHWQNNYEWGIDLLESIQEWEE